MRPPAAYKTKTEMGNAFIFDFDGTLAETIPLTLAAIRSAYADNGLPAPSESEIVANFGSNEFGMFAKMTPECAEKLFESYVSQYRALHAKYAPEPFAGIGGILRKIKNAGWKLGLVTGKQRNIRRNPVRRPKRFRKAGKHFEPPARMGGGSAPHMVCRRRRPRRARRPGRRHTPALRGVGKNKTFRYLGARNPAARCDFQKRRRI